MTSVTLKHGRERSVLRRHPWVFSGALEPPPCEIAAGEAVRLETEAGGTLGLGWWSSASQIRVRLFHFGASGGSAAEIIQSNIREAVKRRVDAGLVREDGAVRLVNAENDFLPGLVADSYCGHVVLQLTSAGADANRALIADAIMAALPGAKGVSERRDADARMREHLPREPRFVHLAGEEPPKEIVIREADARFAVDVRIGHKTGFYLDQRDARAAVAGFSKGRDVLNTFCYTGGFGIYAALAGARSVVQVDSSAEALSMAARNAALNGFGESGLVAHVQADVFKYLRKCRDEARSFDLIVLDPPKFADSKSQLMKAARGYKDINLLAMKLLRPGGVLATFSCSGAMTEEFFTQMLAEAAADARCDMRIVARTGHAADHPVALNFPEGRYLKGVLLEC